MPDLEDAEQDLAEQEKWGLSRVGVAVKRLAAAVRLIRARVTLHDQRLDELKVRVDRLDPPAQ